MGFKKRERKGKSIILKSSKSNKEMKKEDRVKKTR